MSLLKRISYPDTYRFVSKPTQYGCKHEKDAREQCKSEIVRKHSDLKITCGFFVDLKIPYMELLLMVWWNAHAVVKECLKSSVLIVRKMQTP